MYQQNISLESKFFTAMASMSTKAKSKMCLFCVQTVESTECVIIGQPLPSQGETSITHYLRVQRRGVLLLAVRWIIEASLLVTQGHVTGDKPCDWLNRQESNLGNLILMIRLRMCTLWLQIMKSVYRVALLPYKEWGILIHFWRSYSKVNHPGRPSSILYHCISIVWTKKSPSYLLVTSCTWPLQSPT